MNASSSLTRRSALKRLAAAGLAAPALRRLHAASPNETLRHASIGAAGMALSDIRSLTSSPHLRLVAVADVDANRTKQVRELFPEARVYQDWRKLLDEERNLDSVNVSTPDHMHAPITMSALQLGLNAYTQKPLTRTIVEARRLRLEAEARGAVTQMGIQIHAHPVHRSVVATIQAGAIGKVKEVHSWSGKTWGATKPLPDRSDPVPDGLDWDGWLGVAETRPYLDGYYHPGQWRKRLEFGTGTFGDMGCHILDPVFGALQLESPISIRSEGGQPVGASWGVDSLVRFTFPGTDQTTDPVRLTWYDGSQRPPSEVAELLEGRSLSNQGSIYVGEKGVLYSPYISDPVLLPSEEFEEFERPRPDGANHYHEFVDACRGEGTTSAPFPYAGPLTEMVLLGCLATRFPQETLEWDAEALRVTNRDEANAFVHDDYREGWKVKGL